jgi:hypothetical protein
MSRGRMGAGRKFLSGRGEAAALENAARKYKPRLEAYLTDARAGKKPELPKVYDVGPAAPTKQASAKSAGGAKK